MMYLLIISVEIMTWMSNYTLCFYMDVIAYTYPNLSASLVCYCV